MEEPNIFLSKSYKRVNANLRDKLKGSFLKAYPHYTIPGCNLHNLTSVEDWNVENVVEQYTEYPYHCDLPRPLLPPARLPRTVIDEEDPALQLLSVKKYIKDDMERLKNYYDKHKEEFDPLNRRNIKWTGNKKKVTAKVPKYLVEMADIMDLDPDPYFEGVYNWYYTGGTLNHIKLNNSNLLLFPFMGELVTAPICKVEDFVWKPLLQNATKCELNGSLLELRHNIYDNSCLILGRYKSHCSLYMLSSDKDKYKLNEVHREQTKIPYVSADLNTVYKNQYCTANVERTVALWDLTKVKCVTKNTVLKSKVLSDRWGTLKFQSMEPSVILYTDRCCVHYLDTRLPFDIPSLTLCPKAHLERCESLSLNFASRQECMYLGSCHSLLMCDGRSPKDCIQQKWTHQFKSPPLMGSVVNREEQEFIILSSQLAGESSIILNTWTGDESPHSYNFPNAPPNIKDTLNESQLQGLSLDPRLRHTFELCTVGSAAFKSEDGNVFAFTQNSIGDIYYQCITHDNPLDKYSAVNCKTFCILSAWEKAMSEQQKTVVPLSMSRKSNMHHVYRSFTNKTLKLRNDKEDNEPLDEYFEPNWKQSLDKLSSYVDILAPELLAAWEICDEVSLPSSAPPHQKVLNWLETSSVKEVCSPRDESLNLPMSISTQELINVSQQEPDITCLDDSNVLQELFLPKVRTKSAKKKRNTFSK